MKPCILICAGYYLPGFKAGGPLQTMANMTNAVGDRYELRIITSDRDLGSAEAYPGIKKGEWTRVGKAWVRYLAPEEQNFTTFKRILNETHFDLVYFQSFFSPKFTLLPRLVLLLGKKKGIPALLAPRGEFAQGCLNHKKLKKKIFLFFFNLFVKKWWNCFYHVSSADEAAALQRVLGNEKHFVALNFNAQEVVDEDLKCVSDSSALRLAFLGRVDVQKNIDYAINALSMVKSNVIFDIYGPGQDKEYMQHCLALAAQVPPHVKIEFKGPLAHADVLPTLCAYDLFFYPTKNENFGHVIHEALRAALPVVISDRTPWHDVNRRNAGRELSLSDPSVFAAFIDEYANMPLEARVAMHQNARQYGIDVSRDPKILEANVNMFDTLIKENNKKD